MANRINEDCDGSGRPAEWTEYQDGGGGTSNWDYTTSPAPLEGTQSLRMTCGASPRWQVEYATFTDTSPCYFFFKFHVESKSASTKIDLMHVDTSGFAQFIAISWSSGNKLQAFEANMGASDSTYSLSEDTTYCCWFEYTRSGNFKVWIDTTTTKPASPVISYSSSGTSYPGLIALICDPNVTVIYDAILVSTTDIGSDPFGEGGGASAIKLDRSNPIGIFRGMYKRIVPGSVN